MTTPLQNHSAGAQVARLGDIVTIWAHPDDESYLAGGLMALAAATGANVTCVIATAGELNAPAEDRAALGQRRTDELTAALGALGVEDHVLLGFPDGGCAAIDPEIAIAELVAILKDRRPKTVITFGADGFTGHPDHRTVSRWVDAAVRRLDADAPNLLHNTGIHEHSAAFEDVHTQFDIFESGLPTTTARQDLALLVELEGPLLDAKLRALAAHGSQTTDLMAAMGIERYRDWISLECFVVAPGH